MNVRIDESWRRERPLVDDPGRRTDVRWISWSDPSATMVSLVTAMAPLPARVVHGDDGAAADDGIAGRAAAGGACPAVSGLSRRSGEAAKSGRQRDQHGDAAAPARRRFSDHRSSSTTGRAVRGRLKVELTTFRRQQETHLWLFFEPSFSSSATVAGNGETRCTGPFAMSATVWPLRATAVTSAPFDTR